MLGMKEVMLAKVDLSAKKIVQVQTAEPRDEKYMYIFYYDKGARPRTCIASWVCRLSPFTACEASQEDQVNYVLI